MKYLPICNYFIII